MTDDERRLQMRPLTTANAVRLDALATGGLALALLVAAPFVDGLLGISTPLVYGLGALLLGYALVLELVVARRPTPALVWEVIVLNLLWVVASVVVVLTDVLTPTTLATAVVLAQAAAVLALADLQYLALRHGARGRASVVAQSN